MTFRIEVRVTLHITVEGDKWPNPNPNRNRNITVEGDKWRCSESGQGRVWELQIRYGQSEVGGGRVPCRQHGIKGSGVMYRMALDTTTMDPSWHWTRIGIGCDVPYGTGHDYHGPLMALDTTRDRV